MGSTAVRVVTAIGTGGTSEVARYAGDKIGVDRRLLNPLAGAIETGAKLGTRLVGLKDPQRANAPDAAPVTPGMTQAEMDVEARNAAAKRKRDYQDLGRSSTILTSPGGLGGTGSGTAKTLLGM